jgi:hypothetical protein
MAVAVAMTLRALAAFVVWLALVAPNARTDVRMR